MLPIAYSNVVLILIWIKGDIKCIADLNDFKKYFKKTLVLYTSSTEVLKASSIRDVFFPFSLLSILTLGTSLVASSLFNFFLEKIVAILSAIRKMHLLVLAIAKC